MKISPTVLLDVTAKSSTEQMDHRICAWVLRDEMERVTESWKTTLPLGEMTGAPTTSW